jgi:hypothetical protein
LKPFPALESFGESLQAKSGFTGLVFFGRFKRMNSCLAESDLQDLGNAMLEGFQRRVAAIPNDLTAPFHSEARQLETELLTIYKFVALSTRRTEDLTQVAKAWETMVQVCDESAKRLNTLVRQHPHCGAESFYDRVLDLRNKCQRLQQMHS